MGVWLILIVLQPHVSGFIIMSAIILSVFIAAGIPWKSWLSGLLQLLPILLALIVILSAVFPQWKGVTLQEFVDEKFAHAQNRLDTHNNPDEATSDDIHQVRQAKIALGSGGLTGVGLGNGRQKFNYLPEAHNDYVFAIIGEELGFLGTTCVLALFLAFLIIGLDIAGRAERPFAGMLAIGYTILISLQALLNMAVAAQVIPATGISLPFFSFGGSSNLFFIVAAGMILCVSRSGQKSSSYVRTFLAPFLDKSKRKANKEEREIRKRQKEAKRHIDKQKKAYLRLVDKEDARRRADQKAEKKQQAKERARAQREAEERRRLAERAQAERRAAERARAKKKAEEQRREAVKREQAERQAAAEARAEKESEERRRAAAKREQARRQQQPQKDRQGNERMRRVNARSNSQQPTGKARSRQQRVAPRTMPQTQRASARPDQLADRRRRSATQPIPTVRPDQLADRRRRSATRPIPTIRPDQLPGRTSPSPEQQKRPQDYDRSGIRKSNVNRRRRIGG